MESIATTLVSQTLLYGPLGIMCVGLGAVVVYLQRRHERQEERHRVEMNALMERHLKMAETFSTKFDQLADRQAAVLESLTRPRR